MSKLILPDSEPTTAQLLVPSRRGFMKTLSAAFTGLVAAPAIAPACNLMQIHSPTNKLIVAFRSNYRGELYPSLLNLTEYTEKSFRAWEIINYCNIYSLERQGAIEPHREKMFGGALWCVHGDNELERKLDLKQQYDKSRDTSLFYINEYWNNPVKRAHWDAKFAHHTSGGN